MSPLNLSLEFRDRRSERLKSVGTGTQYEKSITGLEESKQPYCELQMGAIARDCRQCGVAELLKGTTS